MLKSLIKRCLLGTGRRGRTIPFGLYKGLRLSIDPAVESLFYLGLYERETNTWLQNAIQRAATVVDAGAGCGELSMWALRHPNVKQVLAYDSSSTRWPIFEENARLNGFKGDSRLKGIHGMFLGPDSEPAMHVLGSVPEPILMKIDVDGGEEAILEALHDVLRSKKCLFLIETHSRQLDDACRALLDHAGYRVSVINPAWWRCFVPEQRPADFNRWLVAERG
jgi:precorrin-6B methylase 2